MNFLVYFDVTEDSMFVSFVFCALFIVTPALRQLPKDGIRDVTGE